MDELFRQRLHDAEVPPPPFVWPAVEQALQERRRRKMVWLLALGLLSAATLAWFLIRHQLAREVAQLPAATVHSTPLEQEHSAAASTAENSTTAEPSLFQASPPGTSDRAMATATPMPGRTAKREDSTVSWGQRRESTQQETTASALPTPDEAPTSIGAATVDPLEINALQAKSSAVASVTSPEEVVAPTVQKPVVQRKKTQPKLCYDFDKHPKAWLLDVYAGPSLAQSSMTSHPDNRPYLNQRLGTESRSLAMNAGIRASIMFKQNLLLRTGVHFDQVTEVFEYIDPTYVKLSINTVVVNGQVVRIDTIIEYGENYQKTYNRYSMLDVPLTFGVEMRSGRSGFSINAGASANVLFLARGSIIDPGTREPARFGPNATLSQDVFQQRVGISAMASVQWFWHVTQRTRLFVEPAFRQVLRPITLGSHPVEQRYSILGLRLGATTIF